MIAGTRAKEGGAAESSAPRSAGTRGAGRRLLRARWGRRPCARWVAALCVSAAVIALPTAAWACPQCALGRDAGAALDLLVLGILAAPFVVVAFAVRAIARIAKRDGGRDGRDDDPEEGSG